RRGHAVRLAVPLSPRRPAPAGDGDAPHRVTRMKTLAMTAAVAWLALATGARAADAPPAAAMDKAAMVKLLETLDDRQENPGDFKMLAYLEQKERDKTDVVSEALIYRRGADRKLIILFTKPKAEAGQGYL